MTRVTQILDKFSKPIINALLLLFFRLFIEKDSNVRPHLDPTRAGFFLIFLVIISVNGDVYLNKVERCGQLH